MTLLSRNLQIKMGNLIRLPLRRGVPPPVPPATEYLDEQRRVIELLRVIVKLSRREQNAYSLTLMFLEGIITDEDKQAAIHAVDAMTKAQDDGKTYEECKRLIHTLADEHVRKRNASQKPPAENGRVLLPEPVSLHPA